MSRIKGAMMLMTMKGLYLGLGGLEELLAIMEMNQMMMMFLQ